MRMAEEIIFSQVFLVTLLAATFRMATPILLAALGEIVTQRSGILNLGIEGMMTMGAFAAFLGAYHLGNIWIGILFGLIIGGLIGLFKAFLSVSLRVNQVIAGLAITMFGIGITGFLIRLLFGVTLKPPIVGGLEAINIPVLSQIPIVGPILFQHNIMVYLMIIFVPILATFLSKAPFGLKMRAVGENPLVADTLGINVYRTRYICVIFGGIMAGLAGAYVMLNIPNQTFMEYMVGGRGWMALALVIFSKRNPYRAFAGALLLGGGDALQFRIQALNIAFPNQILAMLPYVLAMIAIIITSRWGGEPAALCKPYKRD